MAPDKHSSVKELAANAQLAVYKLEGGHVFNSEKIQFTSYTALILLKGKLHFTDSDHCDLIQGPAFADTFVQDQDILITTSPDFEAYFLVADLGFFHQAITPIIPNFINQMYKYVQRSSFSLLGGDCEKLLAYIHILTATVNDGNHLFQYELTTHILRALLFEAWNIFSCSTQEEGDENVSPVQWKSTVSHFFYLVRTYCKTRHEVKWYAEQLCTSPDALSIKLKRIYKKNASQIINEHLLAEAKTLLCHSEGSIQDVSETLHFSDQAAFCKFFKRCSGMSPSEYKKRHAFQ